MFGFLAWELKENWRLYAANRSPVLRPIQIGSHGETMRRLLIPGLHSGTIPKLFTKLRRQLRADRTGMGMVPADEALAELASDIEAVAKAECLGLLKRTRLFHQTEISVAEVRLATNRVHVSFAAASLGAVHLTMAISHFEGRVTGDLVEQGWMSTLDPEREKLLRLALSGLAVLCGADQTIESCSGQTKPQPVEPID